MFNGEKISEQKRFYFIGIGGIGMSALARYFNFIGKEVFGYDKVKTKLTRKLVSEGIEIHYEDRIELIPEDIDVVVYTPAIPDSHQELNYCKNQGLPIYKRSQILGLLSKEKQTIAIAGTHGKTSTSSIIAHNLTYAGKDISAFIGGIMKNYNSNYLPGKSNWMVVEADEYDRSFLTLEPDISILISVDPDHLDIYNNQDLMLESFKAFLLQTKANGLLIIHEKASEILGDDFIKSCAEKYRIEKYSLSLQQELANEIGSLNSLFLTGNHNIENSIASSFVAKEFKIDKNQFKSGLKDFEGIKRRFELVLETDKFLFVDDYAHHPSEIDSAVSAMRKLVGTKKICGIFQPHLFSRTRDFSDGFAKALSKLDTIILLDIYPARELPIEGITSDIIFNKIIGAKKIKASKHNLIEVLEENFEEVILTIGAGDIDTCVPQIKTFLESLHERH